VKNLHEDRGKKGAVLKGKRPKAGDRKRERDDMDREEGYVGSLDGTKVFIPLFSFVVKNCGK
jgi:hypothetical protein